MTGEAPRRRRTQQERREATRTALLDATVACLIEYGYAGVTTTRVVERAGVSRGAQVHHFHTKADLVSEAVSHLAEKRLAALRRKAKRLPDGPGRVEAAVDLLFANHTDPLFQASIELWVAARTDKELRERLLPVEQQVIADTYATARELFGERAERSDFNARLGLALAAIQGISLLSAVLSPKTKTADARDLEVLWQAIRVQLIELFETPAKPKRRKAA